MTMLPDVAAVARIAREVAAAEIMPRFGTLATTDIRAKNHPQDLVTTADVEAERCLAGALTTLVPDSVVIGEEAAETDPGILARLAGAAPVWLIDPVDGTVNFARGEPCFATIIAYCLGGETVAGWILDPVADRVVWTVTGQGAWIDDKEGCRQVRCAPPRPIRDMAGSLGFGVRKRLRAAGAEQGPGRIVRYGCTGREYMDLGQGVLDFAQYRRLKPWDHAAGVLIHQESGGFGRVVENGEAYRPQPRIMEETLLLAPDQACWERLRAVLASADRLAVMW